MIREYAFLCADCMECREKDDCCQCGMLMEEMLLRLECVSGVRVDMAEQRLCIETEDIGDEALAELLEDAGLTVSEK